MVMLFLTKTLAAGRFMLEQIINSGGEKNTKNHYSSGAFPDNKVRKEKKKKKR